MGRSPELGVRPFAVPARRRGRRPDSSPPSSNASPGPTPARARATTGTGSGLGLAVVAAITAAHGGRVGVHSAPGRTEFTPELPLTGDTGADTLTWSSRASLR